MSGAVASVEFKAIGAQQVVSEFKNVGSAAGESATKIGQSTSAMKSLGTGMKSSLSSVGQVASAFATLSLSVVNTWRSYRDLGDAQLKIDKTTKKLHATELAIKNLEAEIKTDKAANAKGSLNAAEAQAKYNVALENYKKHQKDGKHTAAQLKLEYIQLQKLQKEGIGNTAELTAKEEKLGVMREGLANTTQQLAEDQERYNDIQQNFYLSLLPTALAGIGALTQGFSGLKGVFTGGGGLIGLLGPVGIGLTAISLEVLAFQTNFLGLRDSVGGVITWFKERFGAWKDTLQEVFGFIQKGDWSGAFNRIKTAAVDFWNDLKNSVPFFGTVETIINKIKGGDWHGAFHVIAVAGAQAWADLKKAVPFFEGVEIFVNKIRNADWAGAWKVVAKGAQDALGSVFGANTITNFITQVQQIPVKLKAAMNTPGATAWSVIDAIIPTPVKQFQAQVNAWTKEFGTLLLNALKGGIAFVAHTWIDPFLASLFKLETWQAALTAINPTVQSINKAILDTMFPIPGGKGDQKNNAKFLEFAVSIFKGIGDAVHTASAIYLPGYTAINDTIVSTIVNAFPKNVPEWQNVGIRIWNGIVDGFKTGIEAASGVSALTGLFTNQVKQAISSPEWKNLGHAAEIKITPKVDPATLIKIRSQIVQASIIPSPVIKPVSDISTFKTKLNAQLQQVQTSAKKPVIDVKGNTSPLQQVVNKAIQNINKQSATIKIRAVTTGPFRNLGLADWGQHASGFMGTVKRPTPMIVGEGGRPEDVYIKPRGSAGLGPSGGRTKVVVEFLPEEFKKFLRYSVNDFQGAMK